MLRKALSPPVFQPVRNAWKAEEALETGALRQLAERLSGSDLGPFFDFWVFGDRLPDYRLRSAAAKPEGDLFMVTLQVENAGTGSYPAPVVVQTEEGARHSFSASAPPGGRTGSTSPRRATTSAAGRRW